MELGLVAVGQVLLAFAFVGMMALWYWMTEGNSALEHHLRPKPHDTALRDSLSGPGMLTSLVIGALLAPVIEEILFRGLLFDAWARRWGAFVATILTSALFASYHPHFFASFTFAILFVCVVRRTGTLWGSIAVHSFYNLMMWYPLVGQFVFPDPQRATGDITTWGFNLACLLFAAVSVPAYVLLAVLRPHYPRPGAH